MKLARLTVLYFEPAPEGWRSWEVCLGEVKVQALGNQVIDNGKKLAILAVAQIDLKELPALDNDGAIVIPEEPRRKAEQAIEIAANHIAVSEMCKRSISSPNPSIALIPKDEKERDWLNGSNGIYALLQFFGSGRFSVESELKKNNLTDRLDGIALLAEAMSNDTAKGKFHELMRLFERAFKRSSKKLIEPLYQFLKLKGYSESEVAYWIKLRHRATHADRKSKPLAFESDIWPVIYRMEIAAYDVLFNKIEWNKPSAKRRNIFSPPIMWDLKSKKVVIEKGTTPTMGFKILDQFGAYPKDLSEMKIELPQEWYVKTARKEESTK